MVHGERRIHGSNEGHHDQRILENHDPKGDRTPSRLGDGRPSHLEDRGERGEVGGRGGAGKKAKKIAVVLFYGVYIWVVYGSFSLQMISVILFFSVFILEL
jgi:hypothetical protein